MPDDKDRLRKEADSLFAQLGDMSNMEEAAATLHEIYVELRKAGFKRLEALWIVGYIMSAGAANTGLEEEPGGNAS